MKKRTKQIAAILCVVLLAGLYLATFVFALIDSPNSGRMFQASLFGTIAVPILLWIYIWLYRKWKDRNNDSSDGDSSL